MRWLDKLFNDSTKAEEKSSPPQKAPGSTEPPAGPAPRFELPGLDGQRFGRYTDNNKQQHRHQRWYDADALYREKKYPEAIAVLFGYLRDKAEDNVHFNEHADGSYSFELFQGTKRVHGHGDAEYIKAWSPLAIMDTPAVPAMRRLLSLNYNLMYTRCGMSDDNTLCMVFESDIASASPTKLYSGLRELATRADRQDDLLLADFTSLRPTDTEHVLRMTPEEQRTKYQWFRRWLREAAEMVSTLNADSFAGAISYVLLGAIYRTDFMFAPEAKLLAELERIHHLYWDKKDETAIVERNQLVREAVKKLPDWAEADFAHNVYHARSTFSHLPVAKMEKIKESINGANRDTRYYTENGYHELALRINEYGMLYPHFLYSMPRIITNLTTIYLAVLHPEYFRELGLKEALYDPATKTFSHTAIEALAGTAIGEFKERYPQLRWDAGKIRYTGLFDFATSWSEQVAALNLENKR